MIRLNYGCDKRVRYCALIFAADIVPSLSTIQWDLKKPACESTEGSARPLKKRYRVKYKSGIFEKGHRPIWIKLHFWNRHIISYRMVFVVSFEHFMTFRRTVCRTGQRCWVSSTADCTITILKKLDSSSDLTTCFPIMGGGVKPNIGGSTHNWGFSPSWKRGGSGSPKDI